MHIILALGKKVNYSISRTRRLAFDALDIRVYASHDTTEIRGVIPLELALPPLHKHRHHCSVVGIAILRAKAMLC